MTNTPKILTIEELMFLKLGIDMATKERQSPLILASDRDEFLSAINTIVMEIIGVGTFVDPSKTSGENIDYLRRLQYKTAHQYGLGEKS